MTKYGDVLALSSDRVCISCNKNKIQYPKAQLCRACYKKKWKKSNPDAQHRWNLKRLYGISQQRYQELLEEQDGRCAICGRLPGNERLHVDHDHRCCPGKYSCGNCIRGLLCGLCNRALGNFGDSPDVVLTAYFYLTKL